MNIRPMQDRLLIKPAKSEEVSPGGIIVPDTAKKKPLKGKVIAAGPGMITENGSRLPMDIKVGDVVMFDEYSGTQLIDQQENYLIIKQNDVLAIFEN